MPYPEAEWLRGARQFDVETLGVIYDHLSPELYRYAYRLLGEDSIAEEIVAETFHRFLRSLRRGVGPTKHLRAYLYRVAHNLAMDHHRHKVHREPTESVDLAELVAPSNPAQDAERRIVFDQARQALWGLTADQRQVIVLKYFQGLSNQEIASSLKKPIGAIKSLQHRGLLALRTVMNPTEARVETNE